VKRVTLLTPIPLTHNMAPNEYMCVIKNGIDLIKTVQTYFPMQTFSIQNSWIAKCLMLLSILVSIFHSTTAFAGTTVALSESYAGNLSFVLTAGSFRTESNDNDHCAVSSESTSPFTKLPQTATIIKAYLYWTGSSYNGEIDNEITLNNSIPSIIANRTYTEVKENRYFYNGVADITSYVNSHKELTSYTVSDLDIETGGDHCSRATVLGGWALLVIYEDDSEDFRVLNLYEGFEFFQNESFDLIPNNFKLPSTPTGKHAHITWEGDDSLGTDGEFLAFEGNRLTDSGNPSDNQFNSFSNIENGLTTYGVDVDEYDISTYLNEGDEEVTTTYSAGQDLIILSAEIISVSNIPVADLAVTTSTPTGWQANSTVTKKFTISNNGPNDVPTQSVRFITSLPAQLTFNGSQGDSDWLCSQNGQDLSCVFQNKLRSGWSDYLDLTFDVGNVAGTTVDLDVSVDHDTAPYDIFDNQTSNNTYSMSVPVATDPVVDLSASSKVPDNLNGDLLLAGDTLQYTITIDDASDLAVSGIQVTDDMPANITAFRVTAIPSGATDNSVINDGINLTGYLDIQNISLAVGATEKIIIEVDIDPNAADGASLQNQATLTYGSDTWLVDTGEITVVEPDLSPSTIEATDKNSGLLQSGDTVSVTITLDDLGDLDISGLQLQMGIPSVANDYTVITTPANSVDNSSTQIDITDIDFLSGETPIIVFEFTIDPATPEGTQFSLSASLILDSITWIITGPTLEITNSTPSTGNKQLYLDNSNTLSRNQPADGEMDITDEGSETWTLAPALLSDFTFSLTDISVELKFDGNRNGGKTADTTFDIELEDSDGNLLASKTLSNVSLVSGTISPVITTLDKNASISSDDITISTGKQLALTIFSSSGGNNSQNNRRSTLHIFDGTDTGLKGDGYSSIILNASTVINVDTVQVWDAAFIDNEPDGTDDSGASQITESKPDTTVSIRAEISDPFGAFDISSANISVTNSEGVVVIADESMSLLDDQIDDTLNNIKTFEKTLTLAEENEVTGYWTIDVTAFEGIEGDVEHTLTSNFQISPFLPNIALTKSITVINDPINGSIDDGANPKAIPGAELLYSINAINSGRGKSDDGSLILQDEIPLNSDLYVGNITCSGTDLGPVCFKEGSTPHESGLSFVYVSLTDASDDLFFSTDGSDFTYEPVDSGDGYDPAIRYIRMAPANELNNAPKDASAQPEFNFYYQIRLN